MSGRRIFRPTVPDGVDRELRFHLEERAKELEAMGLSREDAEREALRRFGNVHDIGRQLVDLETAQQRSRRRSAAFRGLWRDLRHGARLLARRPGFAALAILTLALGIGANAAIYSVVNAVLLRPLPYDDAGRLVMLWESEPTRTERSLVRPAVFLDWRERATSFSELAAYRNDFGVALTGDGDPAEVQWAPVTVNLFRMLGVRPVLGRLFSDTEAEPGHAVVLMSHATWRGRYGGDPSVLGRTVELDGSLAEVIGVLPPDVRLPSPETDFWSPLVLGPAERAQRESHMYAVLGRLAPGVTVERAQAEMREIAAAIRREQSEEEAWTVRLVGLRRDLVRNAREPLILLFGAVGLVLLVACANVSNLLLARAVNREREVALRAALGAGRGGLVRQFLAESLVLAVVGGIAATLVAIPSVRLLARLAPDSIPMVGDARLDAGVLGYTMLVVLATTVIFGIVPALRASRPRVDEALSESRSGGPGRRQSRLRRALVVGEVALSLVLMVGSSLLIRSLLELRNVDRGYEPGGLLAAWISLPVTRYGDTESQLAFWDELLDRVRAVPGVVSAAGTSEPPVIGYDMTRTIGVDGRPDAFDGRRNDYPYRAVTDGWIETLRVPIVSGRALTSADRRSGRPVIMVNEAMARLAWPGEDAVGRRLLFGDPAVPYEVVGVVGDVRHDGLDAFEGPAVYGAYVQKDWTWLTWMTLVVRTEGDPAALADAVRRAVWAIDPQLPLQRVASVDDLYSATLAVRRFVTFLLGGFAALAITLGMVGLYGVLSWGVASRSREIGVKLALGAGRRRVLSDVVMEGVRVSLVGIAIGFVAVVVLRGSIRDLLFELQPLDPLTLAAAGAGLLITCLIATLIPAMRATRIEPAVTMRAE